MRKDDYQWDTHPDDPVPFAIPGQSDFWVLLAIIIAGTALTGYFWVFA